MKKRVLAAVLLLFITASIPFLTVSIAQLEIWKIIRGLNELGYTAVMEATEYPGETDKAVPFSADAACEIQLAPGNGTLKILAYNSARQLEAGMRERVDYWMSPKAVNPVMTTAYVYQTRRALIWYQPGAASSEDPVRDYLNNTAQPAESYIQPTKAEQEVRAILHDLQNMGYTISENRSAERGSPEFTELAGEGTFSAEAVRTAQIQPGEGALLFHEYDTPEQREKGAKERRDFYATISHSLDFYETEHTLVTFACPAEQAEHGDTIREYLERFEERNEP